MYQYTIPLSRKLLGRFARPSHFAPGHPSRMRKIFFGFWNGFANFLSANRLRSRIGLNHINRLSQYPLSHNLVSTACLIESNGQFGVPRLSSNPIAINCAAPCFMISSPRSLLSFLNHTPSVLVVLCRFLRQTQISMTVGAWTGL